MITSFIQSCRNSNFAILKIADIKPFFVLEGGKRSIEDDFPGLNVKYNLLGCTEKGKYDVKTNTRNMCRECVYGITLPTE